MNRRFVGLIVYLVFLFHLPIFGQSQIQSSIRASFETGPLLSNGTDWGDEIKDLVNYRGVDIQFAWQDFGNNFYSYLYRYPKYGFGINSALNNNQEIGQPIAIYGFLDIPFSRQGINRKVNWGYFNQLGLGFNLKPYDPDSNPINQYIGSKVNCYIHLGLYSSVKISERVNFNARFGLKHFSNGATKRPNAGINLFPVNVGVDIKLGDILTIPLEAPKIPEHTKRNYLNFALYTGMKNYEIGDPSYLRGGLGVNYLIEPVYKYRIGLGLDLFWAQGMDQRFPNEEFNFKDQTSLAIVGSWEWQLSEKLYVPIGLGVYLYRNELNQEWTGYYERIGVRYRMLDQLFAGMQIKAHKAKADFFEFTIGYTLPTR